MSLQGAVHNLEVLSETLTITCCSQALQRPFNYAIVDEVDSLLIDEGRNPMLINMTSDVTEDRFKLAAKVGHMCQTAGMANHCVRLHFLVCCSLASDVSAKLTHVLCLALFLKLI